MTETKKTRVARGTRAPRVTVRVTDDLISSAARRDSGHCMIADAIKAAVPDARGISVDLASIRWTDRAKGLRYIYLTPRVAQLALLRFDQGDEAIEPFDFMVRGATVVRANTKTEGRVPKRATVTAAENTGMVPERAGGEAPPVGPLTNSRNAQVKVARRREFGLRALSQ